MRCFRNTAFGTKTTRLRLTSWPPQFGCLIPTIASPAGRLIKQCESPQDCPDLDRDKIPLLFRSVHIVAPAARLLSSKRQSRFGVSHSFFICSCADRRNRIYNDIPVNRFEL